MLIQNPRNQFPTVTWDCDEECLTGGKYQQQHDYELCHHYPKLFSSWMLGTMKRGPMCKIT
jgi:hypothetical protein